MRPFALLACAALAAGAAHAAQPVTLKSAPVDGDGVVTLGDIFDGAGIAASSVVAPGAKDGGSVILDAARVQAAARAAGLQWANPAGLRRIAVRSGGGSPVVAEAGSVEALVYARSLKAGEIVQAADVSWAPLASRPADAPEDAEAVIGMTARKPLRSGAAVSERDLTAAKVIGKDETVSVAYRAAGVNLVLQGKALASAALGEPVRVLNVQSKRVVEAIAAGPGYAVVGPEAAGARASGPSSTFALR